MKACLVRGSGDVGSAVAHALFNAGLRVAIHDTPAPLNARRGRAFVDALFDGQARLQGVEALHAVDIAALESLLQGGLVIPVTAAPFDLVLARLAPALLVDARMRKREIPEHQMGLAPLTIGLGPNFVAGETTDLVVETAWGDDLGRVIVSGPSLPFTGEPRVIDGHARARYVHAPIAGVFTADAALGATIARGTQIGRIGDVTIRAPLDGVLVGLTRPGVHVDAGAKIVEVDPRVDPGLAFRIGERAGAIAAGVLAAMQANAAPRSAAVSPLIQITPES